MLHTAAYPASFPGVASRSSRRQPARRSHEHFGVKVDAVARGMTARTGLCRLT